MFECTSRVCVSCHLSKWTFSVAITDITAIIFTYIVCHYTPPLSNQEESLLFFSKLFVYLIDCLRSDPAFQRLRSQNILSNPAKQNRKKIEFCFFFLLNNKLILFNISYGRQTYGKQTSWTREKKSNRYMYTCIHSNFISIWFWWLNLHTQIQWIIKHICRRTVFFCIC